MDMHLLVNKFLPTRKGMINVCVVTSTDVSIILWRVKKPALLFGIQVYGPSLFKE